ncbi:MAG TPA: hypothetical protein P5057_08430 [Acidobacteriota bacterium]|nr:hypothetical protein [Acidobacteriota bacterium]
MDQPVTLSFESFWGWLQGHSNCIARAGTEDAVFYDDEEFHWHFGEVEDLKSVQILSGKRLVGEFYMDPERVSYVQILPAESGEEWVFELVEETEDGRYTAYVFVLVHDYNEQSSVKRRIH